VVGVFCTKLSSGQEVGERAYKEVTRTYPPVVEGKKGLVWSWTNPFCRTCFGSENIVTQQTYLFAKLRLVLGTCQFPLATQTTFSSLPHPPLDWISGSSLTNLLKTNSSHSLFSLSPCFVQQYCRGSLITRDLLTCSLFSRNYRLLMNLFYSRWILESDCQIP
jgi:hypothetical protein